MSATLGGGLGERVAALLGRPPAPAPLLVSEGRALPVHTVHLGSPGAAQPVAHAMLVPAGLRRGGTPKSSCPWRASTVV